MEKYFNRCLNVGGNALFDLPNYLATARGGAVKLVAVFTSPVIVFSVWLALAVNVLGVYAGQKSVERMAGPLSQMDERELSTMRRINEQIVRNHRDGFTATAPR